MNRVRILETNVLHASGVIYWLDGTTAAVEADMQRVAAPLDIRFSARPADLSLRHGPGRTAFWRKPTQPIIAGEATDLQKALPLETPFAIAGTISDESGLYNPRSFSLMAGAGASHRLVLYPTPLGVRFGKAGGLSGTLRRAADETPVPYALLDLEATILGGLTLTFRTQSDARGDFRLPLTRLPPLPESVTAYAAELRISAPVTADPAIPVDPDDGLPMRLGSLDSTAHAAILELDLVPGETRLIRSFEKKFLSVQPN